MEILRARTLLPTFTIFVLYLFQLRLFLLNNVAFFLEHCKMSIPKMLWQVLWLSFIPFQTHLLANM